MLIRRCAVWLRTLSHRPGQLLLLLMVLAVRGVVPRVLVLVAGLYMLHLWWALQTLRAGLTFENIRQLQVRYRALYAIIGLLMVAGMIGAAR